MFLRISSDSNEIGNKKPGVNFIHRVRKWRL